MRRTVSEEVLLAKMTRSILRTVTERTMNSLSHKLRPRRRRNTSSMFKGHCSPITQLHREAVLFLRQIKYKKLKRF